MIQLLLASKKNVLPVPSLTYFFGDSITFGVGASSAANRYSTLTSISTSLSEINAGLSQSALQSNAGAVLAGIDRYEDINNFASNEFVVILYGINDCLQVDTYGMTLIGYQTDMETILTSIKQFKKPKNIIVCTLTPSSNLPANGIALRDSINDYILTLSSLEGVSVVDVAAHINDNGGISNFPDGTHPNDTGHQLISDVIVSKINQLL